MDLPVWKMQLPSCGSDQYNSDIRGWEVVIKKCSSNSFAPVWEMVVSKTRTRGRGLFFNIVFFFP